jgi:Domain of unknown function (DUF5703)/Glycosyl hydrolase family 95 catalytic domain
MNIKTSLSNFNEIWHSPSKDHNGSMPIGNGETGLNLWVEPTGDIVFLVSRTDAWDENERLCKIGRVRIKFLPEIDAKKGKFSQTLNLYDGTIEIYYNNNNSNYTIKIWVDANEQVANLEFFSNKKRDAEIQLEIWRTEKRSFRKDEDMYIGGFQYDNFSYPDTLMSQEMKDEYKIKQNQIWWYHRNVISPWEETLKLQYLDPLIGKLPDPLLYRTFGACIKGLDELFEIKNDKILKLKEPRNEFKIQIITNTLPKSEDPITWINKTKKLEEKITLASTATSASTLKSTQLLKSFQNHSLWWENFWNRSYIFVEGDKNAQELTRCYILQRWVQACGARGNFPVKFNGSIFTVNTKFDPDYRRWGGHYWFQNTRLVYWPMLISGDFDMMKPFFKMILDTKPLATARNKIYYDHEGWFFPETMSFWGTYDNENFGWDQRGKKAGDPVKNQYIRYDFNDSLEFLAIMIEYYQYTEDTEFLKGQLLPTADDFLIWWEKHWAFDEAGKIVMEPSQALETYWGVRNPTNDLAGLRWCLQELLKLSESMGDGKSNPIGIVRVNNWTRFLETIPQLPLLITKKGNIFAPAEPPLPKRTNVENPELYCVFPFKLYGVERQDLELARETFNQRIAKSGYGWSQEDTQAAHLGLVKEAQKILMKRVKKKNRSSRFPVFWGPNYDWIPDQDHGSNLLMALQYMLLQTHEEKILLFPAWPKKWSVKFKINAPKKTVLEGELIKGKVKVLNVTPENRTSDVKKCLL